MISSTPRHCCISGICETQSKVTRPPVVLRAARSKADRHFAFGRLVHDDEKFARAAGGTVMTAGSIFAFCGDK